MYQAFVDAFSLLAQLDSAIIRIVLTSIQVSLTALILGTLIGLPLGAWLATEEFAGKKVAIVILNSLMGVPTVIVGVLVYLILSRSGPFGEWGWLFTVKGMIVAQFFYYDPTYCCIEPSDLRRLVEGSSGAIYGLTSTDPCAP